LAPFFKQIDHVLRKFDKENGQQNQRVDKKKRKRSSTKNKGGKKKKLRTRKDAPDTIIPNVQQQEPPSSMEEYDRGLVDDEDEKEMAEFDKYQEERWNVEGLNQRQKTYREKSKY